MTKWFVLFLVLAASGLCLAQSESATLSGRVSDSSGAAIVGAEVVLTNTQTNVEQRTKTNEVGLYVFAGVHPGTYRVAAGATGFRVLIKEGLTLHVQDELAENFSLTLGAISESITVTADATPINTTDASVSTVIDRTFAGNLPLNGRSFNTLLQLTPGVVIAPSTSGSPGQFSIAGQRTDANNFTIDGVSANFGVGNGAAGGLLVGSGTGTAQAFSILGSTSSLVSVDALQEFRVETSSFAPEFGKTPGGQVILRTRSGTNSFHGGLFDYFRNTVMDANDWFNNQAGLPRAPEHHNDFGGFLGGPIWKDNTFFFFSYEGARLDIPTTPPQGLVPFLNGTTCSAPAAIIPFLDAYPKPNGPVSEANCNGQFTGSYPTRDTLNATSLRIDHTFSGRFSIFGRYNDAPSQSVGRGGVLSNVQTTKLGTQTLTVGLNMVMSTSISNSVRGNYSQQDSNSAYTLDSFGGAVPLDSTLLLGTLSSTNNLGAFGTGETNTYLIGRPGSARTRQLNFADDLVALKGAHQLKFGADYRAIFLDQLPRQHETDFFANSVQELLSNGQAELFASTNSPAHLLTESFSLYGQDTWKISPRLTVTYGLRWELSPAPSARERTTLASWINVNDPATLALAPSGTSLWKTTYGNFAPRIGIAYSLRDKGDLVVRAGGGVFYDLGVGFGAILGGAFPNFAQSSNPGLSLPVADVMPFLPAISLQPPFSGFFVFGFDPHLKLARSYQWNLALEKTFGSKQAITATYVGQAGRDLTRLEDLSQPNQDFAVGSVFRLETNHARSNYNALQLQYRRSLSSGLQTLLNYSWSHSLDNSSDDSFDAISSTVISGQKDYGSSTFDVRQSVSGALTYEVPAAAKSGHLSLLTKNWSVDSVVVARTGVPFNAQIVLASAGAPLVFSRPDLVPGMPFWIANSTAPGGKILNINAFSIPSTVRQGTEGRNDIPGLGLTQVDLSIGRKFPLTERLHLDFRADAFNLFNHPNFFNPPGFVEPEFGGYGLAATSMLNQQLGATGLSSLFNEGGPRSLQLSLKLSF